MENNKASTARVLIVDDMRVNRLILSSMLAAHGVESEMADSGAQCLELCRNNAYDLILLDHRMPDTDGVETLIQLKEMFRRTGHDIPIICHTTEDARPNINLYKAAGFVDLLIKPIQPEELSQMLIKYLPEGYSPSEEDSDERARLKAELAKLPKWLQDFEGLDLEFGLENCATAEDYLDALTIFSASISAKAAEIERLLAEDNYGLYAIKLSSLSSMANLIGARAVSETAADLEYAVKHGDTSLTKAFTPRLLRDYRAYMPLLSRLRVESRGEGSQ